MKEEIVRKNLEFKRIYKRGRSFSNKLLVLYVYKSRDNVNINRLGISVSKKVGISVTRSRVKRLIKESYRLNKDNIKKGFDFVIIARVSSSDKTYKDIDTSLINLFKKAGLYNNEGNFYKGN